MTPRQRAIELNAKALKLRERGEMAKAVELFERCLAAAPGWSVPMYNLGLVFKSQRRWKLSLEWNQKAVAADPKSKEAWWNLGIAATALERWDVARAAWRGYGIEVPDGDGPADIPCGMGPIRLHPEGNPEVVWAHRLDPARAEIASIPFPESKHRWGDIVLNDGAPTGYRRHQGQDIPVFDAIQLLKGSMFGTYVARVVMPGEAKHSERLTEVADHLEGWAEDWTTSVRFLCKMCSEGRPHAKHDTKATPPPGVHCVGVAARSLDHAAQMLDSWKGAAEEIRVESLKCELEPWALP